MGEIQFIIAWAQTRMAMARRDERGEVTEKVLIIAIFAALAITVGAIIVAKVTDKTNATTRATMVSIRASFQSDGANGHY